MATEPQKTNLKILFNGSIDSNLSSIVDSESKIKEIQPVIDNFDPACKGLDNQIVTIVTNINTLKSEIVTLYSNAYAVGCGTTVGVTTVFPDTIVDSSFNLSSSTYDSDDPYTITNTTLTNSNVGFGTFVIYTPNNNQVTGLGSAYADIDSCYGVGCISGNCTNFANQITTKQNEIISLQSQLNDLTFASNSIKTERVEYQIIRWADKYSIRTLKEENQRIKTVLNILDDAKYDPYI
jgi:hypothetical protein